MKPSTMGCVELILALAVGFGLARACRLERAMNSWWDVGYVVEPFLIGVSLVAAGSLAADRLRGRGRAVWGVGRWWITFLGILIPLWISYFVFDRYYDVFRVIKEPFTIVKFGESLRTACSSFFYGKLALVPLAFVMTDRICGTMRDSNPDGREIAGRILLGVIVAWCVVHRVLPWFLRP